MQCSSNGDFDFTVDDSELLHLISQGHPTLSAQGVCAPQSVVTSHVARTNECKRMRLDIQLGKSSFVAFQSA